MKSHTPSTNLGPEYVSKVLDILDDHGFYMPHRGVLGESEGEMLVFPKAEYEYSVAIGEIDFFGCTSRSYYAPVPASCHGVHNINLNFFFALREVDKVFSEVLYDREWDELNRMLETETDY